MFCYFLGEILPAPKPLCTSSAEAYHGHDMSGLEASKPFCLHCCPLQLPGKPFVNQQEDLVTHADMPFLTCFCLEMNFPCHSPATRNLLCHLGFDDRKSNSLKATQIPDPNLDPQRAGQKFTTEPLSRLSYWCTSSG